MAKDMISMMEGEPSGVYDIYAASVSEIRTLTRRIESASTLQEACEWGSKDRLGYADLTSAMISVACTSSLCAYLRPGEPWQLDYAPENGAKGLILIAELHRLRGEIVAKREAMTPKRVAARKGELAEAIALLALSLDAVPAHHAAEMALIAGISRTNDPQGDAQLRAEELSIRPDQTGWRDDEEAEEPPALLI